MIEINSIEEYLSIQNRFIEPLIADNTFKFNISRDNVIKWLFPSINEQNDQKYYKFCWNYKPHWCENCGKPLKEYSSVYISHIKTKGAHTEIRYDPLNSNILCFECHNKWEYSTLKEKQKMYVYWLNVINERI